MNDFLKDKLQIIANDNLLLEAIRAVFDEAIEKEKPQIGEMNDNVLLGEKYRSYEKVKQIIEQGFVNLKSYKISNLPPKIFNKER